MAHKHVQKREKISRAAKFFAKIRENFMEFSGKPGKSSQKNSENLGKTSFSQDNNLYNPKKFIISTVRSKFITDASRKFAFWRTARQKNAKSHTLRGKLRVESDVPCGKCRPAMQLTISRCYNCKKARLVDRVEDRWVCFACKQRAKKMTTKPIDHFVKAS